MKSILKIFTFIVLSFVIGYFVGEEVDPIGTGLDYILLFIIISIPISWMFDTLLIEEYKLIYNKIHSFLDKTFDFQKYSSNKEKNMFRNCFIVIFLFMIPFLTYNVITNVLSLNIELLGSVIGIYLIYLFSLKFLFRD